MSLYQLTCECCGKPWRHDCVIGPACQCDPENGICAVCHHCHRCCKCPGGFKTTEQSMIEKLANIASEQKTQIKRLQARIVEQDRQISDLVPVVDAVTDHIDPLIDPEGDHYSHENVKRFVDEHHRQQQGWAAEFDRQRAALAGVMLIADDMTGNTNDRLARISKRCHQELYPELYTTQKGGNA